MFAKPIVEAVRGMGEKKFTVEFPERKESFDDRERCMLRLDMDTCISCTACEKICPNKTISMVEVETEHGTKAMPQVGMERCMFCGLCEEVCPTKCLVLTKGYAFEAYDRREFVKRPEELRG